MPLLKIFIQVLGSALNCICVRAFFDALRNTFNVSGRTSQLGLVYFLLVYVSGFLLLLPVRVSWSLMYAFALVIPLISLWIRRLHDFSWAGGWTLVLFIMAGGGLTGTLNLLFCALFLVLCFVSLGLLFLTAPMLCFPESAEDNRYGPKPLDMLTTNHPETPYWNLGRVVLFLFYIGFLFEAVIVFNGSCRGPFDD